MEIRPAHLAVSFLALAAAAGVGLRADHPEISRRTQSSTSATVRDGTAGSIVNSGSLSGGMNQPGNVGFAGSRFDTGWSMERVWKVLGNAVIPEATAAGSTAPGVYQTGSLAAGHCVTVASNGVIQDSGVCVAGNITGSITTVTAVNPLSVTQAGINATVSLNPADVGAGLTIGTGGTLLSTITQGVTSIVAGLGLQGGTIATTGTITNAQSIAALNGISLVGSIGPGGYSIGLNPSFTVTGNVQAAGIDATGSIVDGGLSSTVIGVNSGGTIVSVGLKNLTYGGGTLTASAGGVTSLVAGTNLTGGTITSSGTIALATSISTANMTATGQFVDSAVTSTVLAANSGGTVVPAVAGNGISISGTTIIATGTVVGGSTTIIAGPNLTGGTISTTGTIGLATVISLLGGTFTGSIVDGGVLAQIPYANATGTFGTLGLSGLSLSSGTLSESLSTPLTLSTGAVGLQLTTPLSVSAGVLGLGVTSAGISINGGKVGNNGVIGAVPGSGVTINGSGSGTFAGIITLSAASGSISGFTKLYNSNGTIQTLTNAGTINGVPSAAVGNILVSGGVGVPSSLSANPTVTGSIQGAYLNGTSGVQINGGNLLSITSATNSVSVSSGVIGLPATISPSVGSFSAGGLFAGGVVAMTNVRTNNNGTIGTVTNAGTIAQACAVATASVTINGSTSGTFCGTIETFSAAGGGGGGISSVVGTNSATINNSNTIGVTLGAINGATIANNSGVLVIGDTLTSQLGIAVSLVGGVPNIGFSGHYVSNQPTGTYSLSSNNYVGFDDIASIGAGTIVTLALPYFNNLVGSTRVQFPFQICALNNNGVIIARNRDSSTIAGATMAGNGCLNLYFNSGPTPAIFAGINNNNGAIVPFSIVTASTITANLAPYTDFYTTISGAETLSISNPVQGQAGTFDFIEGATIGTLSLASNIHPANQAAITLTGTVGAHDLLSYKVDERGIMAIQLSIPNY